MNPTSTSTSTPARSDNIEPAVAGDSAAIAALLAVAGLPPDDIGVHLRNFFICRIDGRVAGAIGMEIHGADALLRSLVVAPAHRGNGLGLALVRALTSRAKARGVGRFFLLTTTAASFFARIGFARVERVTAPAAIASSTQFQGLCPASAICLMARVTDLAS